MDSLIIGVHCCPSSVFHSSLEQQILMALHWNFSGSFVYDGDNIGSRQKRWPALMRTTRCSTRSKTSWQRLYRCMWSASFCDAMQRLTLKSPETKAKVERCRLSDMDKFKCIGLPWRTQDYNRRSDVERKETVEYITTMVKYSLVKRISGVLMLDK